MARPEYQVLIQPSLLLIPAYCQYGSCVTRPYRSMRIKSMLVIPAYSQYGSCVTRPYRTMRIKSMLVIPAYSQYGSCVTRPYRSMRIKSRPFYRPVGSHVRILRRNIPFVHRLKYLDVISDRTRKCRIHTEVKKTKQKQNK
jgi:hypothetical protein